MTRLTDMERLKPIDLERAPLKRKLGGYDRNQTEELLSQAAEEIGRLLAENQTLRVELESARAEASRYRSTESMLTEALVLAQRAADETRAAAQKQAENILEDARISALAERTNGQQKVSELRWEIERLRLDSQKFRDEYRALLERELRNLSPDPACNASLG